MLSKEVNTASAYNIPVVWCMLNDMNLGIDIRIDPDEVPAGALRRFETLVKKHPELGEKRIPTTTFPKKTM
jgi:hypothetical protein